jgi:hypothetical protein
LIIKELDTFAGAGKFEEAGRKAEEQMAYYLRRFFAKSDDVDVINYLRIDLGGEVAQMDHLVLHPYGILIVESKSVTGSVQIKEDGQWIRWWNKQSSGMRSPIIQANMQGMLLKELLSTAVKQKNFFDNVRLDVLVAISDGGVIQWPASGSLPEVCKADQVHERITSRVDQFRRIRKEPDVLKPEHRRVIGEFLCKVHKPLLKSAQTMLRVEEPRAIYQVDPVKVPAPPVEAKSLAPGLPVKKCKHCGGVALDARSGQFGYYFHCAACEKNTGIKFNCPACSGEGRVRKQGKDFFAECKSCNASSLYHSNES